MKLSVILSTIPTKHPLRAIRTVSDEVLEQFKAEIDHHQVAGEFSASPDAKSLLKAFLLGTINSIQTDRQLLDHIDFNVLFRWFVGIHMEADIWSVVEFAKRRAELTEDGMVDRFFAAVMSQPRVTRLLSGDLFSVDGSYRHLLTQSGPVRLGYTALEMRQ